MGAVPLAYFCAAPVADFCSALDTETKGGANSGDDSFLQRQPTGIGLEDD